MIDMVNDDDMVTYSFRKSGTGETLFMSKDYPEDATWAELLDEFVTFLEASGYLGVRSRISIEESPFVSDGWSGATHNRDDWK